MNRLLLPELPDLWTTVHLGEITKIVYGKTLRKKDRDENGSIPVYGSNGIVGVHSESLHPGPSIIIGRKGTAGAIHFSEGPFWCIDTTFYLDEISEWIEPEYLAHILQILDLSRLAIVVGVPGINRQDIEKEVIPLPPLPEQRRIVEILRQAEALRALRRQADAIDSSLLSSIFDLVISKAEKWVPIRSVTEKVDKVNSRLLGSEKFIYIDISSIDNQEGRIVEYKEILGKHAPSRARQRVLPGDVLVSTVRPNLRNTAMIEMDSEPRLMIASTGFAVLRAVSPEVTPFYLYLWTRSELFTQILAQKAQGGGYPAVLETDIFNVKIPIVDDTALRTIDDTVRVIFENRRHKKQIISSLNELQNALLANSFTGELTAAWREAHTEELRQAAAERDRLLGLRPKAAPVEKREVPSETETLSRLDPTHSRYHALQALSKVQYRAYQYVQSAETYLTPESLAEIADISTHQARRTLRLFESLGLVVPVSVPLAPSGDEVVWVDVFRPVTPDDDARGDDLAALNRSIHAS